MDFDSLLSTHFKSNEPGAAIIVTRDGETLFRNAYGMADMERGVPLQPDAIFRLGSLTKQFTATAIMMLSDQGRLSVKDEITKFLTDYPTQGKTITIENLLTHTSGVKNYTAMATFKEIMATDMTVEQMIDFFRCEPLEFEPGSRFAYSNSGYFLLGAIIERVSGQSYASFMAQRIFEPLGMTRTAYEGHERRPGQKAVGYSRMNKAPAVSMTQPYAAGALAATVDDLAKWDAAISSGELLDAASWKQIFTPFTLTNGQTSDYAYGWGVGKFKRRATIEHGGGIPGFATHAIRIPEERLYVAVLMNDDGGEPGLWNFIRLLRSGRIPQALATKAAAMAMSK